VALSALPVCPEIRRKPSVIIVEGLPLFGEALARLLEELGARVVGRTTTLEAGLRYLNVATPRLFFLDRDAGVQVGVTEMIRTISRRSPTTRIVLVFAEPDRAGVRRARRAGARSCLLKTDRVSTMRMALKRILAESVKRSARARQRKIGSRFGDCAKCAGRTTLAQLTERECQVLPCLARGLSTKETAAVLGIRPKTVDVHKTRLMAKLGVHDRATLTRLAIREDLVPLWPD
jgi:DNA-binding NarL/FixJ family response regulator